MKKKILIVILFILIFVLIGISALYIYFSNNEVSNIVVEDTVTNDSDNILVEDGIDLENINLLSESDLKNIDVLKFQYDEVSGGYEGYLTLLNKSNIDISLGQFELILKDASGNIFSSVGINSNRILISGESSVISFKTVVDLSKVVNVELKDIVFNENE